MLSHFLINRGGNKRRQDHSNQARKRSKGFHKNMQMFANAGTQAGNTLSNNKRSKLDRQEDDVPKMEGLSRFVFGFPDKILTKLRYATTFSFTSTTGSLAKYQFRCNSIYDPDYTGGGHQPLYRDEYAALYDHYTVIGSSIDVQWINTSSSPFQVGINIDDDVSATSNGDVACEQNHAISSVLSPSSGSYAYTHMRQVWGSVEVLSLDPYLDGSNKTDVGSDPTEISIYNCFGTTIDGSTNTLYAKTILEFTVLFSELKTPTTS